MSISPESRPESRPLWLSIDALDGATVAAREPSLAWIAEAAGVAFEAYHETRGDGALFAAVGSTVLGGGHLGAFNYLHATWDVTYFLAREETVFSSSIARFGRGIAQAGPSLATTYREALRRAGIGEPPPVVIVPAADAEIAPYVFPEIFFRRAVAFPATHLAEAREFLATTGAALAGTICLDERERAAAEAEWPDATVLMNRPADEVVAVTTRRIADNWRSVARGVAFGDGPAILSQLATLCRERRVALFGAVVQRPLAEVRFNSYAESRSAAADAAAELANDLGDPVIVGRQTCDGDIFAWSAHGVAVEILDPNRPPFPIVRTAPQKWAPRAQTVFDLEPDDAQLEAWADEGRVLCTLVFHSGEMAHNEAMLNLIELCQLKNFRVGMGVQLARYETVPQAWELLATPREQGGALGLVEPLLHASGMGVLAEAAAPRPALAAHVRRALDGIRAIAGDAGTPRGYLAFMDSDLESLRTIDPTIYKTLGAEGLEYCLSSCRPGRNLVLHDDGRCVAINQSSRGVTCGSPFVRVTTAEDIAYYSSHAHPGWAIGVLDAPVVAFSRYIWENGRRLVDLIDHFSEYDAFVNVTPRVVARYARVLARRGILPPLEPRN